MPSVRSKDIHPSISLTAYNSTTLQYTRSKDSHLFALDSLRKSKLSLDRTLLKGPQSMPSNAAKSSITGTTAAAKDAGFQGFQNFLESHGLRIWNDDDVQEGKAILRAMGYNV